MGRMRPFHHLISLDEARKRCVDAVRPLEAIEEVGLDRARGRVLAQPVVARINVPGFDRAGMDGYALIASETQGASAGSTVPLTCIEDIHAGHPPKQEVKPTTCSEIATGAGIPDGADAVIRVEDTSRTDDKIEIHVPVEKGKNVIRKGDDIRKGDTALHPGDTLTVPRLGVLAALGCEWVRVFRMPVVAVVTTGDEIIEVDRPLKRGQVHDINGHTLRGVIEESGGLCRSIPTAGDREDALKRALQACAGADLLVFTAGSSVGVKDKILDVVARHGDILFHGVAVKPGKPTLLARLCNPVDGRAQILLGLPGYPTSCLMVAHILLCPMLRKMCRISESSVPVERELRNSVKSPPSRHQLYPVRLEGEKAVPVFRQSHAITSLSGADGYFEIPVGVDHLHAGTRVQVFPYRYGH